MRSVSILLVCLWCSFSAWSQDSYIPFATDNKYEEKIESEITNSFNKGIAKISSPYKKQRKKLHTERFEMLKGYVQKHHYVSDSDFLTKYQNMFSTIINANPILMNENLRLLISRYESPNAVSYGEGTIVLNLGLISKIQNDHQLAFVLCHEIAHRYLRHSEASIEKYLNEMHGKKNKKKLKKLKRNPYSVYERGLALVNDIAKGLSKYSREREIEADSMALVLLSNTKYSTHEAISCLQLLDNIDQPKRSSAIDFEEIFNSPEFKIKKSWLEEDEGFGLTPVIEEEEKALADSLKTHPDCKVRIAVLSNFQHKQEESIHTTDVAQYEIIADLEIISAQYEFEIYGRSMYNSLNMLEDQPKEAFLYANITNCLYHLYRLRSEHKASYALPLPDDDYHGNFNKFLEFMHRLRMNDLAELGFRFGQKYSEKFSQNEAFLAAYLRCAFIVDDEAFLFLKEDFLQKFPNSKYIGAIENLNK